jgi:catechol 2,3-dioxygenase-like lactoylglutathione lyase family enzyme
MARLVGFNHVAIEVGDIDEALAFYGRLFEFKLRSKGKDMAFIDRVEIVAYDNVQFSKAPNVLRGMGLAHLSKSPNAIKELNEKGMAPD